jgi:hypothetical protein
MSFFVLTRVGKIIQECALCTSGIFIQKLMKMEKHAYLNMVNNKNLKDICKKLTFLLITEISDIRLS